MNFECPYLLAMRERAPKMFNQLRRRGQMDAQLQAKVTEAYDLRRSLLAGAPRDEAGHIPLYLEREVDEQVMGLMLEFPTE